MKSKILLLLVLIVSTTTFAQVCTPGTLTSPKNAYILPDSATGINHACAGLAYEQIMYIKAAKDTVINTTFPIIGAATLTATIDSFVIDANITGLPSYLTVASNPTALAPAGASLPKSNMTRLLIKGDSLACVKISGTVPSATAAGTTPLGINVRVYLSNIHSPNATVEASIPTLYPGRKMDTTNTITDYKFIVDPTPCYPAAVYNMEKYNFNIVSIAPNPTNNFAQIKFESNKADNYTLKMTNAFGQVIYSQKIKSTVGLNHVNVDVRNYKAGLYFVSLSDNANTITSKVSVN